MYKYSIIYNIVHDTKIIARENINNNNYLDSRVLKRIYENDFAIFITIYINIIPQFNIYIYSIMKLILLLGQSI